MTILRKLKRLTKSALLLAALSMSANALPEGATIINGNVNINTSGSTQTITQGSNKAIINWNGFNIDVGELVHFVQPSSISAILNRVVGQDPSVIMGALRSNGQVFLVNPNGVVFGQTAQIDVGSLVVSTLNIQDDDFLAGNLNFSQEADKDLAAVINHGTIKIDDNGFLVLTGPMVANDGVILAKVGQVALAAGTQNTVSFDPTGMIHVALPDGASASDGIVSLSQQAAGDILSGVIATSATQAGQIVERDGKIFLDVQSGTVVQAGDISVDGLANQDAGKILLNSTANTILSADSTMSASGVGENSDGGQVYVLSDGIAISELGSTIFATGGTSGDGGFVEQSAGSGRVQAQVYASASDGEMGTFLIDPDRIVIENGMGGTPDDLPTTMYVSEFTLETTGGSLVVLQADDGIFIETLFDDGVIDVRDDTTLRFDITTTGDGSPAIDFERPGDLIRVGDSPAIVPPGSLQITSNATSDINNLNFEVTGNGSISISHAGDFTGTTNLTTNNGTVTISAARDLTGTTNITTNNGSINISGTGDFTGTTNLTTTVGGDISITAPTSNVTGPLNFTPAARILTDTVNADLQLNIANQFVGSNTSSADVTVDALGRDIILNGVDTTGGSFSLTANTISQTNPGNTNVGAFTLSSSLGDIGSAVAPIRIDGSINGAAIGDMFLESVNSLLLNGVSADSLTGVGDVFELEGPQSASNLFSLTSTSSIDSRVGRGLGVITADVITLDAPDVGTTRFMEVNPTSTFNLAANNADLDNRTDGGTFNITNTQDPSLGSTSFFITDGGEGTLFSDDGTSIDSEGVQITNVDLIGDRSFSNLGGDANVTINTVVGNAGTANLTGSVNLGDGDISLTAENVTLTDVSPGATPGAITATAVNGDVIIDNTNIGVTPLDISATATATINLDLVNSLTSTGISAPTVILNAASLNAIPTTTADLTANSTSGNVNITNTTGIPLAFTSDAALGSGNVTLVHDGDLNTGNVNGSTVDLTTTGTGSITSVSGVISSLDTTNLTSAGGVDVDTSTTAGAGDELVIMADGTVVVDNTASGRVDVDIDSNGNPVTFDNLGGDVRGDLNGSSLTITNDLAIDIDSTASTVDATSTMEDVFLFLTAPTVTVTASAVDPVLGDVVILHGGDAVVGVGGITAGTFVVFDSPGNNITSLGTIFAPALDVSAGGDVQFNLFQTSDVDVVVDGSISISNAAPVTVDLLLASLVQGDITYANGLGPANVEKAFASEGNIDISSGSFITATTDPSTISIGEGFTPPGNTIAAFDPAMDDSGGTVTLNGLSINANVTAERVDADSTTGNIILNGNDNTAINIDATSTAGGNVTINETGDVTGTLDGASVTITANSLDIDLGAGVPIVDATATAGLIDILANSTDLQVTASATSADPVVVNNTGGNIATNQFTGDTISVTASGDITRMSGDLAGFTSVTLDAVNITARTDTSSIIANATGNVDITSVALPFFPTTANIMAAGTVDLAMSGDTFLNTVSGTQVNIIADGGGQAPASLTGTVTATTGLDIRADNATLAVDSPVVTGSITPLGPGGDLDITGSTLPGMDINVIVAGTSVITNTGDVTGTLRGTTVDVTAANINAITTSPDITATATAPGTGTITLTGVQTATATADGDIDLSSFGPIVLNDITSATGDVDISSSSGTVTSNALTSITGDLVDVFGNGIDINTQAQRLDIMSNGFTNDLVVNNTGTNITNTTLFSERDITLVNDGDVGGLNVSGFGDVSLTATDSALGGGTVQSFFNENLTLTAGSIDVDIIGDTMSGPFDQNVSFTTTVGDAQIDGFSLFNLNVSGTATGDVILFNQDGDLNVGAVSGANISASTLSGAITQTAGRLTTPGTVTLNAGSINATTDASAVDATSTFGDITLDNDSALLVPLDVTLNSARDITFTTNGDADFISANGRDVDLTGNALTGMAGANTSLRLTGTSIDLDLNNGTPLVIANASAGPIDLLANSGDIEFLALAPLANDVTLENTGGNIATTQVSGDVVLVSATGDITTVPDVGNSIVGATSVTLLGDNINVLTETSDINASSVSGDIDITDVSVVPLTTANINTTGTVDLTTENGTDLNTVSGSQVNITANNGGNLTGTVSGTTGLDINGGNATLNVDSPSVTGAVSGNLDITGSTLAGMNIDVTVPGTSVITNTGDVTGTLQGTTVDVTAANINAATTSPDITATATAPAGTITLTGVSTVRATAPGDVDLSASGSITLNTIQGADITINSGGDFVFTNPSESILGDLVTITSHIVNVDTQATGLNITTTPTDFPEDIIVRNTVTDLDPVILNSANDIFFTTTGNVDNLNVIGSDVNITVTDSTISGGTASATGNLDITAGTVTTLAVVTDTLVIDTTVGDANFTGTNADLAVSGTSAGAVSVVNAGNIAAGQIDGTSITLDTQSSGNITQTAGRLTTPGRVTLSANTINASTDASELDVTSTVGNLVLDNDSANLDPVTLSSAQDVTFSTTGDANFTSVTGEIVTLGGGALTGTVAGITSIDVTASSATLDITTPIFTADLTTGTDLNLTSTSAAATDFDVIVPFGNTTITHSGDVTGTLRGNVVDVTGATINIDSFTPEIIATATAVGGTIDVVGNSTPLTATATADGNINISNIGGRFGTGDIVANNITSTSGNITLDGTSGSVTMNVGQTLSGNLVTVDGTFVDIDTQATGLDITSTSGDVTVDNTVTALDPVTIDSFNDIFFTTTGSADNLNVMGNNVNITVTDSTISGGTAAATGNLDITAGTVTTLAVVTDTLVIDTTVGDANFTGTNANLAVSGTSAGAASVVNVGNIATGQINGTSINLDTQGGGDITNSAGQLTTPGLVSLDANNVSAQTDAGSLTANASAGNVDIDNFTANLDPVSLTATGTVDFNTTGDANFSGASGTVVNLQADGALTGAAGGTTSLALDGSSVVMNVVTPVLDVTSATGFNVQGNSADMTVSGSTSTGDATVGNTGNIATDNISGDNVNVTSSGGNITRNSGALTAGPGGTVTLSAQDIAAETNGDVVVANASAGNVDIDSNIPTGIDLSGSATGTFTANQNGFLTVGDITASTIDLTTTSQGFGNPISSAPSTSLTADQINLDGGRVTVVTSAAGFDVRSDTSAVINNSGRAITSGTLVGGAADNVTLTNDTDITGVTATAQSVSLVTLGSGDIDATANAATRVLAVGDNITLNMTGTELQGTALTGDLTVTANSTTVDLQALATNGNVNITNTGGGLAINNVTGQNVTLDTQNNRGIITSSMGPGTLTATTSATLLATDITVDTLITPDVTATTNGGAIELTGSNPNLTVTANAMGGDITVNNTGNIATNNISGGDVTLDTRTGAVPQGEITQTSGIITATNLTLEGTSVTANTSVSTVTANAPGNISITNSGTNIAAADLIAGGTVGLVTDGTANLINFQGTDLTLFVDQAVSGVLVGNSVNVRGTDVDLDVTAATVGAEATTGNVALRGNTADLTVTASANNGTGPGTGNVTVTNTGNIATNAISGNDVSISADGGSGNITNNSGSITGNSSVTLSGNDITASTSTPSLTAQNANTININNTSSAVQATLGASGTVDLTSSGAVTTGSSLSGTSVTVSAQSLDSNINTSNIQTTTSGDTTLASSSSSDLLVSSSSSTSGDYSLTHQGNVNFDLIQAQNVTIDAGPTGNITDVSGNTIIATGITLTGNTIIVNTQGQIITVSAQGDVTISNSVVDVSALTVDATSGNVTFGTEGDLTITQVAGGPLVSLQADNNINANSGAVVSGTDVILEVGGQITPDLDNPLDVQATNSIEVIAPFGGPVLAQGSNIAAALEGIIPASSVVVSSSSGPVFYNGVLLNPTGGTPPVVTPPVVSPPPAVVDQIGQQNGQVIDDGSVGSAANDGLVESSPTQELVAQLTENAGGGGGTPTEMLVTMEIDELGDLQVSLGEPSPFDAPIDSSETMTADDILDLDTGELNDVKVAVYYDATNDQLVMAVDLRADDMMDLEVGDFQEIPVNLEYSFLSDPKLIIDKLRADDIIDLRVEDLGLIPIKINVYEDDDEDEDEVEEEILKQKNKKKQGETE